MITIMLSLDFCLAGSSIFTYILAKTKCKCYNGQISVSFNDHTDLQVEKKSRDDPYEEETIEKEATNDSYKTLPPPLPIPLRKQKLV